MSKSYQPVNNFQEDFLALLNENESPSKDSFNFISHTSPFKELKPPSEEAVTPAPEITRGPSQNSNYEMSETHPAENQITEDNFSKNYSSKPSIICGPNTVNPTSIFVKNFKIDASVMKSLSQAINALSNKIFLNFNVCKITNEAFDILISKEHGVLYKNVKSLTMIGNLPVNSQPALLQQLLTTPVNFQELFKTNLESLTLKYWNLNDEFLDNSIAIIQLNDKLQYLNLDFNDFKRQDHIHKILRVKGHFLM